MQFGIHAYNWCSAWSNDTLWIVDKAKEAGLDFLEIPLMKLDDFDPKAVREKKDSVGIDIVTSNVILRDEIDISCGNKEYRKNGVDYLKKCVVATAEAGGNCFSGVIYSKYIKNTKPTLDDWKWSADSLHQVAEFAKPLGVTIGLEPCTRYETNLLNTVEQAIKLIDMIGMDNVMVHPDTYHMCVEEKSFYKATKLTKGRLCHFHMCENDRGTPGTGHVDFDGVFRALKENNYHGRVGMEGFCDSTDNMSTWVWRELAPNREVFLSDGIGFLKNMAAKYGL